MVKEYVFSIGNVTLAVFKALSQTEADKIGQALGEAYKYVAGERVVRLQEVRCIKP